MPSAVGVRAWRIIASEEQKEKTAECEQQGVCAAKAKAELQKICDGILALMNKDLTPSASTEESTSLPQPWSDTHRRVNRIKSRGIFNYCDIQNKHRVIGARCLTHLWCFCVYVLCFRGTIFH